MGCLLVANVDNDPTGQAKIVTGSFSGMLRVFLPRERGYRAEDLLMETELEGGPVLALACGRFSATGTSQLAILHPRKLTVYNIAASGGGSFLQMHKLYEHWLEHTAANMTYGPFGGVQGVDFICVQSYDGQVSFFEAEAAAFARYLPNFLVPGPLTYVEASDSFITANAGLELEAFKYKVLAAASPDKLAASSSGKDGPMTSPSGNGVKRIQADWRVVLGEAAIDIRVGRFSQGLSSSQCDIVVLGEHNLFVLTSGGQVTFQKRLEYHPACCTTYAVPGAKTQGGAENLLVATHTKALLVYRTSMLSWAAKADHQPVALAVADMPGMRGAIVALDDAGCLSVMYLGTDPLLNPVGFADAKDLDYQAMAQEHRRLAAIIREHGGGGGARMLEPTDRLLIRAQVPSRLDNSRAGGAGSFSGEDGAPEGLSSLGGGGPAGKRLTIKLYMVLQGSAPGGVADGITLSVTAPEPMTVETPEVAVPTVSSDPADPTLVYVTLATGSGIPQGSTATVVATYTTAMGEPRAQRLDVALPLAAYCQLIPPVKNAEFKVTLTTNRTPPPLTAIFEDALAAAPAGVAASLTGSAGGMAMASSGGGGAATVMSFQFYGGAADVTILVSKAGGRYRVQSDALDGLWLITGELARRLRNYYAEAEGGFASSPEGPFTVSYDDALPLEDYLEVVEAHFSARAKLSAMRAKLEDRAVQFRNVEKRLLMRFKDKNPAPLNQLDGLMLETYDSIIDLGDAMDAGSAAVAVAAKRLSGATQLMLQLIKWRFGMTPAEAAVMRGCLSPQVIDTPEIGWEEMTEAALTHLLRTCLAKSAKEQAVQVAPLAAVKSTERLHKHLSLVLERLAKGMRLLSAGEVAATITTSDNNDGGSGGGAPGNGWPSLTAGAASTNGRSMYSSHVQPAPEEEPEAPEEEAEEPAEANPLGMGAGSAFGINGYSEAGASPARPKQSAGPSRGGAARGVAPASYGQPVYEDVGGLASSFDEQPVDDDGGPGYHSPSHSHSYH